MVLVTAYPLGYALVLSLYRYRLTDPAGREFVGVQNYTTVLSDPVWWSSVVTTAIITFASVAIELVLGFGFAWVMYRIVRGRSIVRTAMSGEKAATPTIRARATSDPATTRAIRRRRRARFVKRRTSPRS